ncbi:hypothetical protein PR048_002237 [Dryococelus australis]|uniref:Uncharacterized protein n=1 Tax=Dryococelus australis TaxID=614101 RepID=A0ABQ9IJT1_9NEOP|nr:hypothetical protein PR048_002237 [Dryococelus australis]
MESDERHVVKLKLHFEGCTSLDVGRPRLNSGMQRRGNRELPEKIRRPEASSGTILTCENCGTTPPGIEPGSPWWEASALTTAPPQAVCEWSSRYKWLYRPSHEDVLLGLGTARSHAASPCFLRALYRYHGRINGNLAAVLSDMLHRARPSPHTMLQRKVEQYDLGLRDRQNYTNSLKGSRQFISAAFKSVDINCVAEFLANLICSSGTLLPTRDVRKSTDGTKDDTGRFSPYKGTARARCRTGYFLWNWSAAAYKYTAPEPEASSNRSFLNVVDVCRIRAGIISFHNKHAWAQENPHTVHEARHQHRFSITVWTGILGDRLIGPYLLPNRLNDEMDHNFIANELLVLLGDIGRGGPVSWSSRSPDLNPLDFSTPINDIQALQEPVIKACQHILDQPGVFQRVCDSLRRRVQGYIIMNGRDIEHLLTQKYKPKSDAHVGTAQKVLRIVDKFFVSRGVTAALPSRSDFEVNRVRFQAPPPPPGPDFRMCESYRTMPLAGGFSRGPFVPTVIHSGAAPYSPRFTLIGSQYLEWGRSWRDSGSTSATPRQSAGSRMMKGGGRHVITEASYYGGRRAAQPGQQRVIESPCATQERSPVHGANRSSAVASRCLPTTAAPTSRAELSHLLDMLNAPELLLARPPRIDIPVISTTSNIGLLQSSQMMMVWKVCRLYINSKAAAYKAHTASHKRRRAQGRGALQASGLRSTELEMNRGGNGSTRRTPTGHRQTLPLVKLGIDPAEGTRSFVVAGGRSGQWSDEVSIRGAGMKGGGETGDPRENLPTSGIIRHDSQFRKSGVNRPGIEPGSPWWEASSTHVGELSRSGQNSSPSS